MLGQGGHDDTALLIGPGSLCMSLPDPLAPTSAECWRNLQTAEGSQLAHGVSPLVSRACQALLDAAHAAIMGGNRAVVVTKQAVGELSNLEVRDLDIPQPAAGEVLVRVTCR